MSILITLFVFILLVIGGTIASNAMPRIPAALFQIILGAILVYLPIPIHFEFESEAFMMLVIAPILFSDAYRACRTNLWVYRKPILLMAVGLVLFSVIIVGTIIYLLIPAMPLAASFALAAILSPTDAVAVKSIVRGAKLPKGLMSVLEGESLLNDAAGLVSFNIAIAAILTNSFSLPVAAQNFLFVSIGGGVLGTIFGIALVFVKRFLSFLVGNEVNVLVIFQIITPVVVYFVSEHFHVSGVIAVVITGLIYNLEKDLYQHDSLNSKTSLLIDSTQDTFGYVLNGFVFVLLGYLLPDVFVNIMENPELNISLISFYIILITIGLMFARFIYVFVFYKSFQAHTFISSKKIVKAFIQNKLDVGDYSRAEYSFIASLCGIHGTVTMAAGLLIPVYLSNGDLFPLRNTILYIASGVVLLSILIGIVFLPLVLKDSDEAHYLEYSSIRQRIIKQAIYRLKEHYHDGSNVKRQIATAIVIKNLQAQQIMVHKHPNYLYHEIHKIYVDVVKAENEQIKQWEAEHNLSKAALNVIKLMQLRRTKLLNYSMIHQIILLIRISFKENYFKRLSAKTYFQKKIMPSTSTVFQEKLREEIKHVKEKMPEIQAKLNSIAIEHIENLRNEKNALAADIVTDVYKNFAVTYFTVFIMDESYEEELKEMQAEAIQFQKDKIMYLKKTNQISVEDANNILKELNYNESLVFSEE